MKQDLRKLLRRDIINLLEEANDIKENEVNQTIYEVKESEIKISNILLQIRDIIKESE